MVEADQLHFSEDGAQRFSHLLASDRLAALNAAIAGVQREDRAGVRLFGMESLKEPLRTGPIGLLAAKMLGPQSRPVRAILFDKTPAANWALGWHQDRTISVEERVDVPGFGPWTIKHGGQHVSPPYEVLAGMITLRVHLDPVPESNSPLLIAPGSHRFGIIPEPDVAGIVQRCGVAACLADAGDVWLYATTILHASKAATTPNRRRVLQVDYASCELPGGLRWLGVYG